MPDDNYLKIPEDLRTLPILLVDKSSPAWKAIQRKFGNITAGVCIPLTADELESFQNDVLAINLVGKPDTSKEPVERG